ncbi:MAG: ABC transporter permease [Deltaproteobacteria bacterium]|nr:ABC transporter permease [Deltaproteobacteria bacterium]
MNKKFPISILFCFAFIGVLFLGSLLPTLLTSYDPNAQLFDAILVTPNAKHWFGTDELGRDLLARTLFGARISLACAGIATGFALGLGVLYGGISGFLGGKVDALLMRILDMLYSIPDLLFFILLGLYLGRDFWGMVIALSCLNWVGIARLTRGEFLKYKAMPFIEGARSCGTQPWRIFLIHLLPQTFVPLKAALFLRIPALILAESTLSFIGLGLKPPHASWGTLAGDGYQALAFYPHLILFPALFIFMTIFSFQRIGTWLNDKML